MEDDKKKKYSFWDYTKMVLSIAFIFTLGVLWSDYLTALGQKIVSKITDVFLREFIALILIVGMTAGVIALIVYVFGFREEEAIQIIQAGI